MTEQQFPSPQPVPLNPLSRVGRPVGLIALAAVIAAVVCVVAYNRPARTGTSAAAAGSSVPAVAPATQVTLLGSGATFPYPLYSKLFAEYAKTHPDVRINYASVGSGNGIRQISDNTTDFGASDAPMTDEQIRAAAGGHVLHVPVTLGAVVPIYNLPGTSEQPLVFSGPLLADIFRGAVTRWNDPAIAKLNPAAKLPDSEITVVHRADGSGTTHVFTEYLCKVSPAFAQAPGRGTTVNWPASDKLGALGNEGVAGVVSTTRGTIGYVELAHAIQNNVAYGAVINRAGRTVHCTLASVTAAATGQPTPPTDLRMSITDAPGADAYPIAAFTYVLVYRQPAQVAKGQQLRDFLKWAVTDGQQFAPALQYAPLPKEVVDRALRVIASIDAQARSMADARRSLAGVTE